MTTGAHRDEEVVLTCELNRCGDVVAARVPCDQQSCPIA
jgi:hypothetical protein